MIPGLVVLVFLIAFSATSVFAQKADVDPVSQAIAELKAGRTDKAVVALNEVIERQPDFADAYMMRGALRMQLGDATGALADLNKAIQLKPDMGSAYHERAILRLIAKDIAGATQDVDSAIANGFNGDGVYTLRSHLRSQQGDLKGALADINESLRLNPNNPRSYDSRAALLLALEDREAALRDLNYLLEWYETDPTRKVPRKSDERDAKPRAKTSKSSNKSASAGAFSVGLAIEPVNGAPGDAAMAPVIANAYFNRGLINSFHANHAAAISDFTKSIRLVPTNVLPYYNRATAFEKRGELEAALADVSRAIQIEPLNGTYRIEHGVILSLLGKSREAQVDFDMLLKADSQLWQKRIDERMAEVKQSMPSKPN